MGEAESRRTLTHELSETVDALVVFLPPPRNTLIHFFPSRSVNVTKTVELKSKLVQNRDGTVGAALGSAGVQRTFSSPQVKRVEFTFDRTALYNEHAN